jgi:hypothetical protein
MKLLPAICTSLVGVHWTCGPFAATANGLSTLRGLGHTQFCGELELEDGAGDRDRTGDIQLGKLAFYR